jgi:UPF0755 protein
VRIDELELSWEDESDRGRHRRRRRGGGGGGGGRGRGGRTAVALLVTLVILGVVVGGVWYGFNKVGDFFAAPDYNSGGTGEIVFEVKKDQTAAQIGLDLQQKGVVKSQKAFVEAAKSNPHSKEIQPGFYRLRQQMRAADALSLLLDLNNRDIFKVTIPEGKTVKDILPLLATATKLPLADFEAVVKQDPISLGIPDWWFNRQDKKQSVKSLEGFLFPSTYEFNPGVTAEIVIKRMITQFLTVTGRLNFANKVQSDLKVSPYEALVVASLAQAEAGVAEDLPKIARVAYNRVYKAKMPLQFDVTANYWLQLNGKPTKPSGQLTQSELDDPKNPYNTVSVLGLPAGPINNPGEAALTGAMAPPPDGWLYFVAIDKQGHSAFATTLAEHQKNIATACANGVQVCK